VVSTPPPGNSLLGGDDFPVREGENQSHALFHESPCVAVHPSDLATALFALDAEVQVRGPQGERLAPFEAFYATPTDDRRTENTLAPDEIVLSVNVPRESDCRRSTYLKAMDRKVWAFALVGVAARVVIDDGRISDARLVLGGVSQIPWRVAWAETLLVGQTPSPELFERVADAAVEGATPLAKNGYKIPLVKTLVRRALEAVVG
jgi:xanthine dehydrogenase YagS FAD-binding subunit